MREWSFGTWWDVFGESLSEELNQREFYEHVCWFSPGFHLPCFIREKAEKLPELFLKVLLDGVYYPECCRVSPGDPK